MILLHVRNGYCARCERPEAEVHWLYELVLEPGAEPTLKPTETHSGLCRFCWRLIGKALIRETRL